ncbi:hypothetical protein MSG28_004620 [Choristoneura fumiferana]|uniref:Uncharacterized protein n=1 Tax=Choristoneura fumiferana TaxID=7141 RepID=A0ACC0K6M4_CHOFU|nr:hypothetical protein MSG28_004620 [Choristoneura fumiferana]
MSIFFDFDVGERGRRFRRAIDADRYEIELFWDRKHTENIFGEVDLGYLIELSPLSICMIDEDKKVIGFMALNDHPNVPSVSPADWELWVRNMFQRYYLSRNTLFIHFMCCAEYVAETFFEEALASVFNNDMYLLQIVLVVPPGSTFDDFSKYQTFRKHTINKITAKRSDDSEIEHYVYVAQRKDFCPKLTVRRAVEEDNDDVVEILDKLCPKLKELYGEYYISEIIGRRPESGRKVIVAQLQERAVGVMCLNSEIDYQNLIKTYDLSSYFGLKKATDFEKEVLKRSNNLVELFADPILLGERSPFDDVPKLSAIQLDGCQRKEKTRRSRKSSGRVNFGENAAMRRSFDHLYFIQQSDEFSDQAFMTSPTPSLIPPNKAVYLEADPFDYEIVNIDYKLLTVPDVASFAQIPENKQKADAERFASSTLNKQRQYQRRQSVLKAANADVKEQVYHGDPNAFMIELYALREDIDERKGYDLLEAAFEIMKDYDYCLIRVPCDGKSIHLLQHFCFVSSKGDVCTEYALYIAHRHSVLGKLRVRKAEVIDVPQIINLIQTLEGKETMWIVENSIMGKKQHQAYVFMSGVTLVGYGIVEPPEQINFIQAKFNLDYYHIGKYHNRGHGASVGFATLKTTLVYPVFETHFRFFLRDMMRLQGCDNLMWLTGYRNKWVIHKANTMAIAMVPLLPRKSESICGLIPQLKNLGVFSRKIMAFNTWFINNKITSITKLNVDARIVVVGAGNTALACLNALLFGAGSPYLTFTNVTLVSPSGLPFIRHCKPHVEMMFLRHRTTTDQFLKSTPYTYYLNVVVGTVVDINKQEKFITLLSGHRCYYDKLLLLFGKQYQHPDYLQSVLERAKNVKSGNIPPYSRLDDPSYREPQINTYYETPDNVFIVNSLTEANKALRFVKNFYYRNSSTECTNQVIVYGAYLHAYCCIAALLEMEIPARNITFVEPFPPEDPTKPRIPVFSNIYVDQTMREVLNELGISVYRSYYFQSWNVDMYNMATHVNFLSHFQMVELECSAMFYYGVKGIDANAFQAIHRSGMAYDAGILIDHQFRTNDPSIFAAGPSTRYCPRYFAEFKKQKFYDSYEVGEKLGAEIRNQLDPLFSQKAAESNKSMRSSVRTVSFDSSIDRNSQQSAEDKESFFGSKRETRDKVKCERVPEFVKPIVKQCMLPGGLQYLEVRSPGMKIPHHYIQTLDFNGYILETFQGGYFKLHLTADSIVDGITCLSPESYSIGHFKNLYGKSAVVLNNVHIKFASKRIDNLYEYFNSPGIFFLYHEHVEELFMMAKELLPMKIDDPLPERVCGRDMVVAKETYRTTTGEYCVKPNPNKAMERADCSINCRRVIFMTGVEKRLQGKTITQPTMISETKDTYRGIAKSPLMPPAVTVRGFGPRHKEIWMPLTAKVHRAVYDRIHVKKECHEVAAVFQSETKKKFQVPFALSPLASWSHGECGKVYPDNTEKCGRSMVQGVDYKGLGAHPWVARIGFTREYDTTRGSDCNELFCAPPTQAIKVENVVVHVGYEQKIFRHDIALIVLKDEMKYSVSVAPICLNDKPEIVINERALLVGWGKLSGQNNLPSQFKKASEDSKVWAKMYYLYFKPISNIISCSPNTQYKEQWLLTKGKMSAVVKNIENAAKLNKLEIKENLSMLSCEKNASSNFVAVIVETLKSKSLLKRFFICIIWWNTCTFVDHGLTLNSVLLKGNKYFNYGLVASLACQEWKRTLVGTAHAAGYMLGIFFVGSLSDRWLLTKGKKNTVVMNIENAAKLNKIEIKENLSTLSYEKETSSNFMAVIAKTFKSKSLLKRFFVCIIWWNTCTFVDHGLLINSVLLKGNRYVNYGVISFKWFNIGLLFILAFFFLDESPRWHLTKGHIEAAVKILNKAAKINKVEIEESLEMLTYEKDDSSNFTTAITDTFKSRALLKSCLACMTDEKEKEAENNYFNLKLFLYQTLYAEEKKKKYKKDYGDDEKQQSIILYPKQIKTSTKSKVVEGRSKIARLSELLKMLTDVLRRIIRVKNGKSFASTEVVRGCPTKKRKIKPMLCHPNSIDKQLGSQHQQIYLEEKSSVKKLRYQTTPYPVQATVEAFCIMSMQVMKEVMDYMMVSTTTDLTMVMATNMSMVMNIMISIITIQAITVMATSAITIIWGTDIIISITIFITSKAMTDDQKAIIRQHFEQLSMECIKDNPITSDDIASLKAKKMDESGMLQKETILQKAKAMTMKQIRNTGKMIRKSCQPKNNVEDEKIDPIKDGVFIEEKEVMCYMACVMKMANTMDGKGMFDVAGAEAMVEKTHGDDTTMIENSKKLFDVCKSDGIQDIKEDIIMLHIAS